ncbi:MAG: hypothetical protein EOO43_16245 [Flavobacterium sp.]|nr:MAG: hypothetical protein EOO43_16245 [Flavobacterium sp.]
MYCNGSTWVSNEPSVSVTPAFGAYNFIGKTLTSSESLIELYSKNYDLTNSVRLYNDELLPSRFIVPEKGIYHFDFYAKLNMINFTPSSDTRITIAIAQSTFNGSVNYHTYFPVYNNDNSKSIAITRTLALMAGDKICITVKVSSPPSGGGIIKLVDIGLEGHLVARN